MFANAYISQTRPVYQARRRPAATGSACFGLPRLESGVFTPPDAVYNQLKEMRSWRANVPEAGGPPLWPVHSGKAGSVPLCRDCGARVPIAGRQQAHDSSQNKKSLKRIIRVALNIHCYRHNVTRTCGAKGRLAK